jgi:hypothetical protein
VGVESYLRSKLQRDPNDASTWRLLGRLQFERGELPAAYDALHRSLSLEPQSAAARFDLARVLMARGDDADAATEFAAVVELAPDSEYGREARALLQRLPPPHRQSPYQLAAYAYPDGTFDGSQRLDEIERQQTQPVEPPAAPQPFHFRFESGLLYNSNVALAPVSRELSPANPASWQAALRPEFQYDFLDDGLWRSSVLFGGQFTLNEGNYSAFNLQSIRPGVFLESYLVGDAVVLVPRVQYEFTHDAFDGLTFGNRNALVGSLAGYWAEGDATFLYWSMDYTDFADDGGFPAVTSRDGWTHALGVMHQMPVDWGPLARLRGGVDVELVDTVGSDFAYNGVSLYGEALFPLATGWELSLQAGWGYRDYPDYAFTPSRNESIWRAGAELRYFFTRQFYTTGQFHFTRFDSESPLFQAERYLTGVLATYEF